MIKHLLSILLAFSTCLSVAHAQQLPLFAQHAEYHGLINPASVNSDFLTNQRTLSAGLSYRSQWAKLGKVAPTTQVLRAEHINYDQNFLVGGYLQNDRVGITNNFGMYGRFAYIIAPTGDLSKCGISIGANIGLAQWQLKTSRLSLGQIDDPDLPNDPSFWYPDIGIGAYWYQKLGAESRYFYLGVSAPRTFDFRGDAYGAKRYPHLYGLAGVYLPFFNDGFLEISTWTRYVEHVPPQSSFNIRFQPTAYFWFGAGTITDFKDKPFLMAECGVTYNTIKIGYGYSWSSASQYFGNAHEINLAFVMDTR